MKKMMKRRKYASGGETSSDIGSALVGALPSVLNSLMSLTDTKGSTNQPIVNAQTMRNMSPYAFGGAIDPKKKRKSLVTVPTEDPVTGTKSAGYSGIQTENGENLNPDEIQVLMNTIEYMKNNGPDSNIYRGRFQHHSIDAKPKNPDMAAYGAEVGDDMDEDQMAELQAAADEQGITIEELIAQLQGQGNEEETEPQEEAGNEDESQEEDGSSISDLLLQGDNTYAMGGTSGNNPIEIEGQEVVQTPDGRTMQANGPSHEAGGIDINVPDGTDIYSKRLSMDGKTMAERKILREKKIGKIKKVLDLSPADVIARNTMKRTKETTDMEEQQDMAIQKAAAQVLNPPRRKYGLGGPINPITLPDGVAGNNMMLDGSPFALPNSVTGGGENNFGGHLYDANPDPDTIKDFTTGDMVGMAGNAFNAIAPILNTRNAARATKPNINRFQGFGRNAIAANDAAQSIISTDKATQLSDLQTTTNSAKASNRNNARSVNAIRALDSMVNMGQQKGANSINSNATSKMVGVLGQRAQLENVKDATVMRGATARDTEDKADTDNYYSNMAQNLTNFGTNVEGIGKSLNVSQKNKDAVDLLGLLTKNGIRLGRKKGRLTVVNND